MKTLETAVLPLAGVGTRMFPATTSIDKSMMPVYAGERSIPLVDFMVGEAALAGVKNLIIVTTARGRDQIQEYFGEMNAHLKRQLESLGKDKEEKLEEELERRRAAGVNLDYIIQKSEKYGNSVPLYVARAALRGVERFGYLGGDDFIYHPDGTSELTLALQTWNDSDADHALMGGPVPRADAPRYGILQTDAQGRLRMIDEKPPLERVSDRPLASLSRFLVTDDLWGPLVPELERPDPPGGEYYMANVVNAAVEAGQTFQVHEISGKYLDGGTPQGMRDASEYLTNYPSTQ